MKGDDLYRRGLRAGLLLAAKWHDGIAEDESHAFARAMKDRHGLGAREKFTRESLKRSISFHRKSAATLRRTAQRPPSGDSA